MAANLLNAFVPIACVFSISMAAADSLEQTDQPGVYLNTQEMNFNVTPTITVGMASKIHLQLYKRGALFLSAGNNQPQKFCQWKLSGLDTTKMKDALIIGDKKTWAISNIDWRDISDHGQGGTLTFTPDDPNFKGILMLNSYYISDCLKDAKFELPQNTEKHTIQWNEVELNDGNAVI